MQLKNYSELKKNIVESDMILVGMGEEWVLSQEEVLVDLAQNNKNVHAVFSHMFESEDYAKLVPFFMAYYTREYIPEKYRKAYKNLFDLLEGKNYFIVSLTIDSYLKRFGFKSDRCVNPCGTYDLLQCKCGCYEQLVDSEHLLDEIKKLFAEVEAWQNDLISQEAIKEVLDKITDIISQYQCENCGQSLTFNTLDSEKYREEGYLKNWQIYMKWLQGTMNRKLCLVEAGVGMKLPSVIRWPFEKTVFYNQKATMFRIHEKYYQVNEEVAERAFGCKCNAVKLFCEENVEASL